MRGTSAMGMRSPATSRWVGIWEVIWLLLLGVGHADGGSVVGAHAGKATVVERVGRVGVERDPPDHSALDVVGPPGDVEPLSLGPAEVGEEEVRPLAGPDGRHVPHAVD